ncbi:protein RGF1 INDUCIBLE TRANSCRIPTION FACTOR 1-like [Carex rostrata]
MEQGSAPLPSWLQPLLASKFFEQCEGHSKEKKNEENHFCMDCACRLCPNCVVEHTNNGGTHNLLQIRHYVHSDVVRVSDVYKLIDVSKIQQYIANSAKVIHLNPKSSKPYPEGVPKSYIGGTPCIICARAISKPNLFCSIACKITEYPDKEGHLNIIATGNACDDGSQSMTGVKRFSTEKEEPSNVGTFSESGSEKSDANCPRIISYRKKSRKGIPVRAPFF